MYKVTNLPMLRFYVSTNINEDEKDLSVETPMTISTVIPTVTSPAVSSSVTSANYQSYDELFSDQLYNDNLYPFAGNTTIAFFVTVYLM